jgi:hypothetical protein
VCCLASSTPTQQLGSCWWAFEQLVVGLHTGGMCIWQVPLGRPLHGTARDTGCGWDHCDFKAVHMCCPSPSSTAHKRQHNTYHTQHHWWRFAQHDSLSDAPEAAASCLLSILHVGVMEPVPPHHHHVTNQAIASMPSTPVPPVAAGVGKQLSQHPAGCIRTDLGCTAAVADQQPP